jgi:hypothetical protein
MLWARVTAHENREEERYGNHGRSSSTHKQILRRVK